MKNSKLLIIGSFLVLLFACTRKTGVQPSINDTLLVSDTIQYHAVRINKADGSILPWYSADPGTSYDTVLLLVWNFWDKMETDSNGLKYYIVNSRSVLWLPPA